MNFVKIPLALIAASNLFFIFLQLKTMSVEGALMAYGALCIMALALLVLLPSLFFQRFASWRGLALNSYIALPSIAFMAAQGILIGQRHPYVGTGLIFIAVVGFAIFINIRRKSRLS